MAGYQLHTLFSFELNEKKFMNDGYL